MLNFRTQRAFDATNQILGAHSCPDYGSIPIFSVIGPDHSALRDVCGFIWSKVTKRKPNSECNTESMTQKRPNYTTFSKGNARTEAIPAFSP